MSKTILITGSTDGIGLETAKMMVAEGHTVLVHGRNQEKLDSVVELLAAIPGTGRVESYKADLSSMAETEALAAAITENHDSLDVIINNAGVYVSHQLVTDDGYDSRFMVNTIAPYLLTRRLLPLLLAEGRVVNLSSAAQAPLDPRALAQPSTQPDSTVYAQSKLAITMWTRQLASELGQDGPVVVAVNPKSLLGSKMVKEAYGIQGSDLRIGADILRRAALAPEFAGATGRYFDNDRGSFAQPHPVALDEHACTEIVSVMDSILAQ